MEEVVEGTHEKMDRVIQNLSNISSIVCKAERWVRIIAGCMVLIAGSAMTVALVILTQ